jgi:hypothetical protein
MGTREVEFGIRIYSSWSILAKREMGGAGRRDREAWKERCPGPEGVVAAVGLVAEFAVAEAELRRESRSVLVELMVMSK